ncbi:hypothetical protein [uncultured Nostoc sp.]|uniref:hypothetical protein n=1 Tax=uncultured Nostoc sp. TaxID=340711 RepID=UPI0035CA1EEC
MANVNQVSFKSTCNRKVLVEELIDGELKGIVGGITVSSDNSQIITAISTDGNDAVVQDSNQDIVNTKTKQRTRRRKLYTFINGVTQTTDATVTSAV